MCLNSSPWLGVCPFSLGLCVLSISNSSDFWDNWEGRWWKRGVSQTETRKVFVNTRCYCCSVATSCLTLCDPMDCSTPGFPVLHSLLKFAQTRVYWVEDTIQPSHPLSPPSPPTLNLSQHQGLFQWVESLHQVVKVLELQLQHQSFQWIFNQLRRVIRTMGFVIKHTRLWILDLPLISCEIEDQLLLLWYLVSSSVKIG